MLADRYCDDRLSLVLDAPGSYTPFPSAADRGFWGALPDRFSQRLLSAASRRAEEPWPRLRAGDYLEFTRTGDRTRYGRASMRRRESAALFTLAECCEHEGRFVDPIIDAVWSICEESGWAAPAHNFMHEANEQHNENHLELPDVEEPLIDLRAVETGVLLALIASLLGSELDTVSVFVRRRIRYEVEKRIITPFLARNDFWWMGFKRYRHAPVNNWNPWCASRILQLAWMVSDDRRELLRITEKVMRVLEVFIDSYPSDGACDEGPTYWNVAAGALFDGLEVLDTVSNGGVSIWDEPLIAAMAEYITAAHIDKDYYVNFADAKPVTYPDPALLHRMGRRTGSPQLSALSRVAYDRRGGLDRILDHAATLHRNLELLTIHREIESIDAAGYTPPTETWHADTRIMTARDRRRRLFVAAKGGHNDESHNHNDVGNYIVYSQGLPVVIDVGVGTYTAKTFDPTLRYSIWTMQSEFHNLPVVNGHGQSPGRARRCDEARFDAGEDRVTVELSIAPAWPDDADLASWQRRITLDRGDRPGIEVADTCRIKQGSAEIRHHFMLAERPKVEPDGVILSSSSGPALLLTTDGEVAWHTERIEVEDQALTANWGPSVYRLVATERMRGAGVRRFFYEPVSQTGRGKRRLDQ